MMRSFFFCCMVLSTSLVRSADWPQWMGPNRDDVWNETGIVARFPEGGLKYLWRKPIHGGFSGPAVADGRVYVTDYMKAAGDSKPAPTVRNALQGTERVLCLDAKTGDEIWKHEYECNYSISYPAGPRCTPTVADGKVYTLGAMGDLFCLNAVTGSVEWTKNLPKTYQAPVPLWGYAGHPLIYKNLLICMAGGENTAVVALDKATGAEIWSALKTPEIGYSPPTLIEAGGTVQLIIFDGRGLHSLNPDNGELYWSEPLATAFSMAIMAPRKSDEFLFAGGHNGKSVGLKLESSRPSVTRVWEGSKTLGLAPVSGTPFVENGIAYGIDGNGLFRAMRVATGERLWSTARPVNGEDSDKRGPNEGATFVTKNGDRFFIFGENGDLVIARLSPERYEEVSRTKLLDPVGVGLGRNIVWSHPAYANKCVFARNDKEIVCGSLAAEISAAAVSTRASAFSELPSKQDREDGIPSELSPAEILAMMKSARFLGQACGFGNWKGEHCTYFCDTYDAEILPWHDGKTKSTDRIVARIDYYYVTRPVGHSVMIGFRGPGFHFTRTEEDVPLKRVKRGNQDNRQTKDGPPAGVLPAMPRSPRQ